MTQSLSLPELVCPAGSLPALKAAIDHGADAVYIGLKDMTNARNFAGLNFSHGQAQEGIRYAQSRGRKVLMAINTFPQAGDLAPWRAAVDEAADLGVHAVILADPGLLAYAQREHPQLRRHLSVQGSATNIEAIRLYQQQFGISRVVLPRVLTLAQVKQVVAQSDIDIEVFGFGSLCVMAEGRCLLSSYATGHSPNNHGACSPAWAVRWETQNHQMQARLNGVLIDEFKSNEAAGYPTLCKGRFQVEGETYYALEEPTSLNIIETLPELISMGIAAIKVEGRQRSPAYVASVTKVMRQALDAAQRLGLRFRVDPGWQHELGRHAEGTQQTLGAYSRPWK